MKGCNKWIVTWMVIWIWNKIGNVCIWYVIVIVIVTIELDVIIRVTIDDVIKNVTIKKLDCIQLNSILSNYDSM